MGYQDLLHVKAGGKGEMERADRDCKEETLVLYLKHKKDGQSIRAFAREIGVPKITVH